jgi:hypothetical protein
MNKPRRPVLPKDAPAPPPTAQPDPRARPDERKEGGPDFAKEGRQREKAAADRRDAGRDPPGAEKPQG